MERKHVKRKRATCTVMDTPDNTSEDTRLKASQKCYIKTTIKSEIEKHTMEYLE
jgi:hypothetical protein